MRIVLTGILVLGIASQAAAQSVPKPAQLVVNNAPAGINIDIFIDAGKVQTATVSQQGSTTIELDFLSLGKPQGQIYVETCKDGQRIRIVTDGTVVPTDEGCNRKPVGVAFPFGCAKKLTVNFTLLKVNVGGCGTIWTNKLVLIGAGVVVTGVAVTSGGGSSPTAVAQPQPTIPLPTISTSQNTTPVATVPVTPPVTVTPPSTVTINPTGTWRVSGCSIGSDPRQHELIVQLCRIAQFIVDATGSGFDITAPGTAFPRFGGPLNTTTGAWQLTASTTVGGSVPATWTGRGTFAASTADMTVVMTVTVNGATDSVTYTFALVK